MGFYFNRSTTAANTRSSVVENSAVTGHDEAEQRTMSTTLFESITHGLLYLLALAVATLSAIAAALMGAAAGYPIGMVLARAYEAVATNAPGQYLYGTYYPDINVFIGLVVTASATFAATLLFCTVLLRMATLKNQIQSIVVLELVALIGVFMIAGDASHTQNYFGLCAGLSVLLAIALLVLKRPRWVYLDRMSRNGFIHTGVRT